MASRIQPAEFLFECESIYAAASLGRSSISLDSAAVYAAASLAPEGESER